MLKYTPTTTNSRDDWKRQLCRLGLLLFLAITTGTYVVSINRLADLRVLLVAFIAPVLIALVITRFGPQLFLLILVLSLSLAARFRIGNLAFHTGGAEAAIAPIDFALLGLLFWWGVKQFGREPTLTIRLSRVEKAFIILLLSLLPSLFIAPDRLLALLELLRLIKMGLLFLMLKAHVRERRDVEFVFMILLLSIIAQGGLALIQTQFSAVLGLGFLGEPDQVAIVSSGTFVASRASGTLGHANALAHFFEMLLPLALAMLLIKTKRRLGKLALVALGFGVVGLYLTLSRGGWAGGAIGLLIIFMSNRQWRGEIGRRRLVITAIVGLIVLSVSGAVFWSTIAQRLNSFNAVSWLFRLRTFETAVLIFQDHPLLGVGANNFLQVSGPYSKGILLMWPNAIVHNVYLLMLAETGLIGLAAFLWFLWQLWRYTHTIRRQGSAFQAMAAVAVWAGMVALLVHSLIGWLLRYDPVHTLFWFHVGLLLAIGNLSTATVKQSVVSAADDAMVVEMQQQDDL